MATPYSKKFLEKRFFCMIENDKKQCYMNHKKHNFQNWKMVPKLDAVSQNWMKKKIRFFAIIRVFLSTFWTRDIIYQ